ncbi:MAG: hypothetical protein ACJA07_001475 [Rhodococcus sp. (in: high G+C Gram-positive bacteria)]
MSTISALWIVRSVPSALYATVSEAMFDAIGSSAPMSLEKATWSGDERMPLIADEAADSRNIRAVCSASLKSGCIDSNRMSNLTSDVAALVTTFATRPRNMGSPKSAIG